MPTLLDAPSSRWRALVVLLASFAAIGCGTDALPIDAGPPPQAQDAGPQVDSGALPDAGAPTDAGPAVQRDPVESLRTSNAALRALIEGHLTAGLDPLTLFEIDLLDEAACQRRAEELRAQLAGPGLEDPSAREALDGDVLDGDVLDGDVLDGDVLDGDVLDGDVLDAGSDAGRRRRRRSDAGRRRRRRFDAGVATAEPDPSEQLDGGVPDGSIFDAAVDAAASDAGLDAGADAGPSSELAALERERDELRLRFLSLPATVRSVALGAVTEQRRIAAEEESSAADLARATAEEARATQARQSALDRAAVSASAIERDLLGERARVERGRADLAGWEATQARSRQRDARADSDRLELAHELERRVSASSLDAEEADRRYLSLIDVLVGDRQRLDEALDLLGQPSTVPSLERGVDPDDAIYRDLPEHEAVARSRRRLDRTHQLAVAAETRFRWERARRLAEDVRRLDRVRIALLPRMSRTRRETVLGLGSEGRSQFARELDQVRILGRYAWVETVHDAPQWPTRFLTLLGRSSSRNELLAIVASLLGLLVLWRRRESVTDRIRRIIHDPMRRGGWRGLARPVWAVVGTLVVPLVTVAGLHVLFGIAAALTDSVALEAARVLVLGVAWLLLSIAVLSRLIVSRLRRGAGRKALAVRVAGSVRLVVGALFCATIALQLSELSVGEGYLYGLVEDLMRLGAMPIAAFLIYRWADDITGAHATRYPTGFAAKRIAKADTRLTRYALTVPAGLQLAAEGTVTAFKELALRFEQSRRAFAFLFRRRLEKQAEVAAPAVDPSQLPRAVQRAFDGLPCAQELEIDHFPGLDPIALRLSNWREGEEGFAVAVIGERGIGKTSWMRALARRAEIDAQVIDVPHHLTQPEDVCRWLGEALEIEDCGGVDAIAAQVHAEDRRRVILLDHCQNLVLRAIGGTRALETLVEVAARTSRSIVWVCSFSKYTWLYLERARQAQDLFSERVQLAAWPEERIVELISRRMDAIHRKASFQDLVVETSLEGGALEDAVLRTEGEYLRLLWDYSDGNPRIATHYWLRSLSSHGEDDLRVRLFSAPKAEALEDLHEQSRFLLAAVVLHENLTEQEAAETAGLSLAQATALFAFLEAQGYVHADERGEWRVTTPWYRAVIRHLRRRRLLFN